MLEPWYGKRNRDRGETLGGQVHLTEISLAFQNRFQFQFYFILVVAYYVGHVATVAESCRPLLT